MSLVTKVVKSISLSCICEIQLVDHAYVAQRNTQLPNTNYQKIDSFYHPGALDMKPGTTSIAKRYSSPSPPNLKQNTFAERTHVRGTPRWYV